MSRTTSFGGSFLIWASFALALLLNTTTVPGQLALFWPNWLTLLVIFWCIQAPRRVGVGSAWLLGLAADISKDALLGQHALALALIAYLTLKTYRQLRAVPVWQQALSVLVFTLIDKLIVFWISGMIGYPPADFYFLLPVLSTLLLWPLLVLALGDLSRSYQVDS